ncbi:hypothetical protein D3867_37345 (plasmid) [Azospirillum argentinense]|uniref:Uncharacterized protein n=2 Tax=Azospirillum TaxID=191 RepID=A0A4D8QQH2_AZOBR|nr:hypothetical protein D3867_37345 [Azospirillum argentinense]
MTPDEKHRLEAIEHRLSVLGTFSATLFRRLGAPEPLITDWFQAWRGGSLYQLYSAFNAIEAALKPPPKGRD